MWLFKFLGGKWFSRAREQWAPTLTEHDPNPPIPLESAGGTNYPLTASAGTVPISGTAAQLRTSRRYALRISGEQDVPQVQTRSGRFPVTMLGWFHAVGARGGAYMGLLSLEEGPGHSDEYNEVGIEGGAFNVYDHNAGLLASVGTASTGVWYKVAFVVTSGAFELYVGQEGTNGVTLLASGAMTNLPTSNDYQGIGGTQFTSTEWFSGRVSNVRIWNTNLSEAEIEAEFRSDTPVKSGVLGAWLRPDVAASNPLVADVGDNLIDGNGGGIPDYTVENGPTLDTTGYTLAADSGAVAITGTAASLERGLKVVAASGAIAISGTAASLELGAKIAAASGAVALTGTAATLLKASKVVAAFGAVGISGTAASLERAVVLPCAPGAVAITGTDATLRRGVTLNAGAVAIPISGSPAVLQPPASSAAMPITGTAAALTQARRLVAAFGTVPFNGTAATLSKGILLGAASGSVSVTGTAATLTRALNLSASSGTTSFSGTAAQLRVDHRLESASGSISLTGSSSGLFFGRTLSAAFGSWGFSGTAATLSCTRQLAASPGSLSISGTDAELTYNSIADPVLEAGDGAIDFTGSPASLLFNRRVASSSGTVSISGTAANIGPLVPSYALPGEESNFTAPRSARASAVILMAEATPVRGTEADALFVEGDERMSTWKIKRGDYHRRLTLDLETISTVGASGVTFRIRKLGDAVLTVDNAGTIDSPTRVSYQFVDPQLETVGRYRVEVRLQYVDGPETVPTEGWLNMEIEPNV